MSGRCAAAVDLIHRRQPVAAFGFLRGEAGLGKVLQRPTMSLRFNDVLVEETVIIRAGKGLVGKLREGSRAVHPGYAAVPIQQVKYAAVFHVEAD